MIRILVVDDDTFIAQALAQTLRAEGYEVVAHTDPRTALEERGFQVVITDFMMPGLNGIDLLGRIKETSPDAVRLMFTAASDFKVALEAVNRGEVFRLFEKPWRRQELAAVVRQAAEHHCLLAENRRLGEELRHRNDELLALNRTLEAEVMERTTGLLDGMVRALDYRDTETQWHSRRVALYTRRIAERVGIASADLLAIEQGALLHDIGKIGVRDSVLLKPGPLTTEEWVEVKLHPEVGFRMLAAIPYLRHASQIVFQHQERWDGKGYPSASSGEAIVVGARIFCIADTLDAITSDRPYRKGRPLEAAKAEIARVAGTQLDPDLVRAFLEIPDGDWAEIRAHVEGLESEDQKRWGSRSLNPAKERFLEEAAKLSERPSKA
jgi:response regulator RpfG family c-di-GMP phosphodiesterase